MKDIREEELRPNTPSGFHKYPNPNQGNENLVKAKALIDECQATQVETRALVDIKFSQHKKYPMHKLPIRVPSIIAKQNEDRLSIDSPLLMDQMFEEDPVMELLRHEGLNNLHDDMER